MTDCTHRKSCFGDVIKQSGYLVLGTWLGWAWCCWWVEKILQDAASLPILYGGRLPGNLYFSAIDKSLPLDLLFLFQYQRNLFEIKGFCNLTQQKWPSVSSLLRRGLSAKPAGATLGFNFKSVVVDLSEDRKHVQI